MFIFGHKSLQKETLLMRDNFKKLFKVHSVLLFVVMILNKFKRLVVII